MKKKFYELSFIHKCFAVWGYLFMAQMMVGLPLIIAGVLISAVTQPTEYRNCKPGQYNGNFNSQQYPPDYTDKECLK